MRGGAEHAERDQNLTTSHCPSSACRHLLPVNGEKKDAANPELFMIGGQFA
jgi:hypothetical protein